MYSQEKKKENKTDSPAISFYLYESNESSSTRHNKPGTKGDHNTGSALTHQGMFPEGLNTAGRHGDNNSLFIVSDKAR